MHISMNSAGHENEEYPVESHVAGIFQYIVVRVTHHVDVAITWRILGAERSKGGLGMHTITD